MVEMHLAAVRVELPTNNPVVLLQEVEGARRTLPIFIGAPEATAIAFALQGVVTPRPMTHDLMRDMLSALGGTLERVVVTELVMGDDGRSGTYFAELHVRQAGEARIISSRPSDAIALAARLGVTIYAEEELLDQAGVVLDADEDEETAPDELVSQFRQFIEGIRPEDFSS
ncbi:MAG TPA: bifunctional nuclease family protein [Acidimicrobiales bacterium]|nr:bifunctional nuclease family protein [Acidimicrobiales bacterium]